MNFYTQINARLTAVPAFTLAARQAKKAAQNDIEAPRSDYKNELGALLTKMAGRSKAEQMETVRGAVAAWTTIMPDEMERIAYQYLNVIRQSWFRSDHAGALLKFTQEFGLLAHGHDNHAALGILRMHFMERNLVSHDLRTLAHVMESGVTEAKRTPKADMPQRFSNVA